MFVGQNKQFEDLHICLWDILMNISFSIFDILLTKQLIDTKW